MNNTQLFLAIGIPSLLVIMNMFQSNRISDKVDRISEQLSAKVDRVSEQLGAKIDRLAADNHRDHLMILRDQVELNERVARVEVKQGAQ